MSISAQHKDIDINTATFDFGPEDVILLCSDGLWNTVSEGQILTVVLNLIPKVAAKKLVDMANINQGPDNISVIIARRKKSKDELGLRAKSREIEDTGPGILS